MKENTLKKIFSLKVAEEEAFREAMKRKAIKLLEEGFLYLKMKKKTLKESQ